MVFVWLVNKIAGIFKIHGSDISNSDVDEDFDKVLQVIQEGFGKIKSRFETVDNEINNIRSAVLLKDGDSSEHEALRQEISSNTSQYNSLLDNIHNIYNRMDVVEQNITTVNTSHNSSELYSLCNDLDSRMKLSDLKYSNIQEDMMSKIVPLISAIENKISHVDSRNLQLMEEIGFLKKQIKESVRYHDNNVATQSNNVTSSINNVTTTEGSAGMSDNNVTTAFKPTRTVITSRNLNKVLPSALIPAFNELLNADKFVSYSELAKLLGKREATARAYVNDLRNRGVAVEEETRENGRKLVRLAKDIRQEYIIPE